MALCFVCMSLVCKSLYQWCGWVLIRFLSVKSCMNVLSCCSVYIVVEVCALVWCNRRGRSVS